MSFRQHPLFSPFVFSLFGGTDPLVATRSRLDATPPADVYRRDGEIVLHVDLPGVDRSTLQVTVDGQWLTIAAERLYTPEPGDRVLLSERPFGRFERRFRLADRVDASGVKANLVDGVLTVTLSDEATVPTSVRIDVAGAESAGSEA